MLLPVALVLGEKASNSPPSQLKQTVLQSLFNGAPRATRVLAVLYATKWFAAKNRCHSVMLPRSVNGRACVPLGRSSRSLARFVVAIRQRHICMPLKIVSPDGQASCAGHCSVLIQISYPLCFALSLCYCRCSAWSMEKK